jgi:hypothetical protein
MAWDPCVSCGKGFHGSTSFTYVSWHTGETRHSYRLRQCLECAMKMRNGVLETADYRDAENTWHRAADMLPVSDGVPASSAAPGARG